MADVVGRLATITEMVSFVTRGMLRREARILTTGLKQEANLPKKDRSTTLWESEELGLR